MKVPRARVNISEYPYGRLPAIVRKSAKWINSNNKKITSSELEDFLPKSMYNKLSPDDADFLEAQTFERRDYFWHKN